MDESAILLTNPVGCGGGFTIIVSGYLVDVP